MSRTRQDRTCRSARLPGAVIALLLAVVLLLAGRVGAAAPPADERPEIEVAIFAGGEGLEFYKWAQAEYERVNPHVKVNLYGDPRIEDKLRVRILEGATPDTTNAFLQYHEMIREGQLLPLDEYLDGPSWDGAGRWRDQFLPGSLDKWTQDGKTYGIPLSYFLMTIWTNREMFDRHGWPYPRTWDELLALCERVKRDGQRAGTPGRPAFWPMAFQGQYPMYIRFPLDSIYFHGAGRQAYVDQQNAVEGSFDNPQFVRALRTIQTLGQNYFQPGAMGMSHTQAQVEFFQGRAAMIPCGSWLRSEMMGKIPPGFRLGTFNLPGVEGSAEPNAICVGGGYFFLFKNAKRPREAVDFLRFLTSRQIAGTFSRLKDIPTPIKGASEGNLSADMDELVAVMNRSTSSYGEAFNDSVAGMAQYWNNLFIDVLTARRTPERIARDMEDGARQVRQQMSHPDDVVVRHVWKPVALLAVLGGGAVYWVAATWAGMRRTQRRRVLGISAGRERIAWGPLLVFLTPAVVIYTAFVIVPSAASFTWSLHRWNGLTDMTWAGLIHFKRLLFENDAFWIALTNNLYIMFVIPAFVLPLSLFLAVCINRGLWGSNVFRVAFFFPNIIGGVAATLLWLHLYNPQGGPVNAFLVAVGFDGYANFPWLSQENLYTALVPMSVWGACGFNVILFLAAMQGIPQELYEAADLDGATPWQQFWAVTLPQIWSAVSVSVVFMVIGGMKAFEAIWLLTNQQPSTGVHVIGTMMVQKMFGEFKIGEATAIAVMLFLMVFVGTAATLKLMNRRAVDVG